MDLTNFGVKWLLLPLVVAGWGVLVYIASITALDWPARSVPAEPLVRQPFRFSGAAGAYFRLWFRVMLLNVVTLGMYSPWGTVRLKKYLYRHTTVDGFNFDFVGNAMGILKGRLLLVGVLLAYSALSMVAPSTAQWLVLLASVLGLPWLVQKALRYKARTTTLAGVPFTFSGTLREAFISYSLGPLAAAFTTLGLAWPIVTRYAQRYRYDNLAWGNRRLGVSVSLGQVYMSLAAALLVIVLFFGLGMAFVWAVTRWHAIPEEIAKPLAMIPLYLGIYLSFVTYRALILRHTLGSLVIEGTGRLRCTLTAARTVFVAWSNALAVLLTLGLAAPWAKVRWLKVLTAALVLETLPGSLTAVAGENDVSSAAVDEFAESIFNMDF